MTKPTAVESVPQHPEDQVWDAIVTRCAERRLLQERNRHTPRDHALTQALLDSAHVAIDGFAIAKHILWLDQDRRQIAGGHQVLKPKRLAAERQVDLQAFLAAKSRAQARTISNAAPHSHTSLRSKLGSNDMRTLWSNQRHSSPPLTDPLSRLTRNATVALDRVRPSACTYKLVKASEVKIPD